MLTVKEAGQKANVEPMTIYRWMKLGLKHTKIRHGLRYVIRIDEMELFLFMDRKQQEKRG